MKKAATVFVVVALMAFMVVESRHAIAKRQIAVSVCTTIVTIVGSLGFLVTEILATVTGLLGSILNGLNLTCVEDILRPLIETQLGTCISTAFSRVTGTVAGFCAVAGSLDKLLGCVFTGQGLTCILAALPLNILSNPAIVLALPVLIILLLGCVTSVVGAILGMVGDGRGLLAQCRIIP